MKYAKFSDNFLSYFRLDDNGETLVLTDKLGGTRAVKLLPYGERTQGEWKHLGGDEWCCSECGHVITTEGSWENPLSTGAYHCENCGADMRKGGTEE